ncbi:MAG: phenylalanine--tRNA ligase subunit alpha [Bacteroidota bacterium]
MKEKIESLKDEIVNLEVNTLEEIESARIRYISKKGLISQLFDEFKNLPGDQKKLYGKNLNQLKQLAVDKINTMRENIANQSSAKERPDLTLPGDYAKTGTRHPISIVKNRIIDIFAQLGFVVSEGPEIEDDWHVFSALNFPPEHPARDMQDTFFIEKQPDILLRTHTSSVQVREMEATTPPLRIIMPGRVFRNEAVSARSHCIFHQVEGLYIDKDVSFSDLKQTLLYFSKEMFGEETKIRLRPSYFPFTEPSAEMDVTCAVCHGKGCNVCKYTGWLEILGCGMVDPNVLDSSGIDSTKYTGFAFGMGIERLTMSLYGINDIRLFFENDIRFLNQFKAEI